MPPLLPPADEPPLLHAARASAAVAASAAPEMRLANFLSIGVSSLCNELGRLTVAAQ